MPRAHRVFRDMSGTSRIAAIADSFCCALLAIGVYGVCGFTKRDADTGSAC